MSHEAHAGPADVQRHDDMNVFLIVTWGAVACVVTFALVIGIQVLYYRVASQQEQRKVVAVRDADAGTVLARQEAKLARYGWLDREQGRVGIPIDRAMQLVVEEMGREAAAP